MPYFPGVNPIVLDKTNGRVGVNGTPTRALDVFGNSGSSVEIGATADGNQALISASSYRDFANGSVFRMNGARGTVAAPVISQENDRPGIFIAYGYNGTAFRELAGIAFHVDGEPTTAGDTTDMPGRIVFSVSPDGASTRVDAMTIKNSQRVGIGAISSPTAWLHVPASASAQASICKPHGAAPTSPVNGDEWTTTTGSFVQINGTTKTYVTVSSPATYTPSNVTTDRAFDANATTLDEVADVLGTLIADLKLTGIIL